MNTFSPPTAGGCAAQQTQLEAGCVHRVPVVVVVRPTQGAIAPFILRHSTLFKVINLGIVGRMGCTSSLSFCTSYWLRFIAYLQQISVAVPRSIQAEPDQSRTRPKPTTAWNRFIRLPQATSSFLLVQVHECSSSGIYYIDFGLSVNMPTVFAIDVKCLLFFLFCFFMKGPQIQISPFANSGAPIFLSLEND